MAKRTALGILFLTSILCPLLGRAVTLNEQGYKTVTGPCDLVFPRDHGAHPDYRTEWWYYTGNLQTEAGRRFGYQLTFFRTRLASPLTEKKWPEHPSQWRTAQLYFAHAAVTDVDKDRHLFAEKNMRGALSLAGVDRKTEKTTVFLGDWHTTIEGEQHRLHAVSDDFGIDLKLAALKPPVLHGEAGYSLKGLTPDRASCYYSLTRLRSQGALVIGKRRYAVKGLSWMDHEFSTAPLEPGTRGWDWFSVQLDDGTELMMFLLRGKEGGTSPASSGTFVDADGQSRHLAHTDFSVQVLDRWKSPASRAVYPIRWRIRIVPLSMELTVSARIEDQEMRTGAVINVTYWEGSVSVVGSSGPRPVKGAGYVELTGYGRPFDRLN